MKSIFPEPIANLPRADVPLDGVTAYLSQGDAHQILFMEFAADVHLPEHAHAAQTGFVLAGRIDMVMDGQQQTYTRGDRYHIPAGVRHSARIHAGYADITFFDEPHRYSTRNP